MCPFIQDGHLTQRIQHARKPRDPKDDGVAKKDLPPLGRNHVFTLTRAHDDTLTRVFLDVAQVPITTNEEKVATQMIIDLGTTLHGALHHYAHDMAVLPQARDAIFNETGIVVVNRNKTGDLNKAKETKQGVGTMGTPVVGYVIRRRRVTRCATNTFHHTKAGVVPLIECRTSTTAPLGHLSHQLSDATMCEHLLTGDNGRLVEPVADHIGIDLPYPEVLDGPDHGATYRWVGSGAAPNDATYISFVRYQLTCPASGELINLWLEHRPVTVPTTGKRSRIENYLRFVPEPSAGFDLMFGLRQDAESANSCFKALLKHRRAPLIDARAQWWAAVGFVVAANAQVWLRHTTLHDPGAATNSRRKQPR